VVEHLTAKPDATTGETSSVFGRVMRFWRGVFGLSQEDLADRLNISLKHVSYLETGRSRPSEALVLRLGQVLHLGERDFQNLLIAANHFSLPPQPEGPALTPDTPTGPLVATLKALDPHPAYVTDPYGAIYMVNRAWAVIWRRALGDEAVDDPEANSYRLFFTHWRLRTVNWEDVGSWLMMSLQQEALLHADPRASRFLREFQSLPYVPRDWALRAALARPRYFYPSINRLRDGGEREYWIVSHSIGPYPLALGGRLWLNIVHPKDGAPDLTLEQIAARNPHHAKLVT
jgi:transcriptional regulator with XRE-family HTH domain